MKRLTTQEFVERAKAIHGDRYDYSTVNYVNAHTNVTIICPDHGPFLQTPTGHLAGRGCRKCAIIAQAQKRRLTTAEFIEKAKAIHGDRYDYSQVEYVRNDTDVTIICPEHGPFAQTPNNHLSGQGCRKCGEIAQAQKQRLTTEEFIEKAKAVHGDRYDYSEVEYINHATSVRIICPDHGPFLQTPNNHLSGKGCADCVGKNVTSEKFIKKAKAIHGDRYDYPLVEYVNNITPVTIICHDHGNFEQRPSDHIYQKSGCPDCADSGFNPNDRATLYYLAITTDDGDTRYKIGITNCTVEERFRREDSTCIRIVKTWRYAIGRSAAEHEAEILSQYAGDKYYGPDILQFGNSELFTHDILGLDRRDEESG